MSNVPIQVVRVSEKGKEALQRLKNRTKINNWNVLCRWALCQSLALDTRPPIWVTTAESNIEMDWKTFAGDQSFILAGLIRLRAIKEDVDLGDANAVASHFRAHLERGISAIQNAKKIEDLLSIATSSRPD
jgi:DNA sulfur modification protein DndE